MTIKIELNSPYFYVRLKDDCIEIQEYHSFKQAVKMAQSDFYSYKEDRYPVCIIESEPRKIYSPEVVRDF